MSNNIKLRYNNKICSFKKEDYYYEIPLKAKCLFLGKINQKFYGSERCCHTKGYVTNYESKTVQTDVTWWTLNISILYYGNYRGFKLRRLRP